MKIKTKIIFACIISIVVPLLFMFLAFLGIGRFLGGITPEMKFTFDQLTKHWLIDLLIACVVILVMTGLLVSTWIRRGGLSVIRNYRYARFRAGYSRKRLRS